MAYAESQTANQKPGNLKYFAPFNERTLMWQNLVSKKREKERIKVSTLDIYIKRSGLCIKGIYPILKFPLFQVSVVGINLTAYLFSQMFCILAEMPDVSRIILNTLFKGISNLKK